MRWSVEVTVEEGRAHLGLEPQGQWSDRAIARTTPVLLGLFSLVTMLALEVSHVPPYRDYLGERWMQSCHNARQLYHELVQRGYPGS